MTALTSTDLVNQALQMIGNNAPAVTGTAPTFDSSANGVAASKLYAGVVATVGRQWGWDMARNTVALTTSGNVAPFPWTVEYLYPANGIEVWQLMPATLADPFNPLPVNYAVANVLVSSVQTKVIHTKLASALAVYNNNPNESVWDPGFQEAVVRLLASELAMATGGRPETSKAMLEAASIFEKIGEGRTD